ncbi:MAG: response regulator [Deltaproteobacteria bacterium]|nr:response regulator [Deltaproteobacteria bacterium]
MSKKAFVVDNDFFFVEFLTELLEKRGYEIIKAYDGKDCISKLNEIGPVDLLFVDLMMPKIDGRKVIEYTRNKFANTPFPIIAVSGTIIEQLDEIDEIGADYYIAKGPMEQMEAHTGEFLPMEQMEAHTGEFLDKIEKQPFPPENDEAILEPGKIYPRQATTELIDAISFQRAVIESIGVGIIVLDRDAEIISTNSLALDMINKSVEDVLNRPIRAMFPSEEQSKLVDGLKRVAHDRGLRSITLSGTIHSREFRMNISLLKIDDSVDGWIIGMVDTEQ